MTKPFDYAFYKQALDSSKLSAIVATSIALACLGGLVSGKLGQKDLGWLLTGIGVGATIAARSSVKVADQTKYILNDYEDISAQTRTNVEFKQLQEPSITIEEYNWETLATLGLPTCVIGDRQESLKIAEWLAWKTPGTSVYITDSPGDVKVSQTIVPSTQYNVCTINELQNYTVSTDYLGIIEAFNSELHYRRIKDKLSHQNEPYVVIWDNPPNPPDIKGSVSLSIYYVVLGRHFDGWQEILVGADAVKHAHERSLLPYFKEVLRRWSGGVFPVLVNGQYALLPQL
ncbi:MAG: hypothetical protein KME59_21430 [Trichormus sp. ATA11-4-KO1]|jgi:hypothetical protein|nr:hypothetical protein [Trichormus sp. ATA11-4-KO1]